MADVQDDPVAELAWDVDAGFASLDALPDDGYGAMIREGLLRTKQGLDAERPNGNI